MHAEVWPLLNTPRCVQSPGRCGHLNGLSSMFAPVILSSAHSDPSLFK